MLYYSAKPGSARRCLSPPTVLSIGLAECGRVRAAGLDFTFVYSVILGSDLICGGSIGSLTLDHRWSNESEQNKKLTWLCDWIHHPSEPDIQHTPGWYDFGGSSLESSLSLSSLRYTKIVYPMWALVAYLRYRLPYAACWLIDWDAPWNLVTLRNNSFD